MDKLLMNTKLQSPELPESDYINKLVDGKEKRRAKRKMKRDLKKAITKRKAFAEHVRIKH